MNRVNATGAGGGGNNISSKINEMKNSGASTGGQAPVSQDAIDNKLAKLQGLLKMAKN